MSDNLPIRASDTERDRVVLSLREHCAAGRLTLEEFSTRADLAYEAATREELDAITRDLPQEVQPAARRHPRRFTISIFGGSDVRGRWRAAPQSYVLDCFGGSTIDLREAALEPETTFFAVSVFGGSDFYVPEGIEVDLSGFAVFGGNDERGDEGIVHPGAPLVRIVAVSLFGGCDVWHVPRGATGKPRELRRATRKSGSKR